MATLATCTFARARHGERLVAWLEAEASLTDYYSPAPRWSSACAAPSYAVFITCPRTAAVVVAAQVVVVPAKSMLACTAMKLMIH